MTHPFELTAVQLQDRIDEMVEVTFGDLQSQFLTLPRGAGFIDYADFQTAYEVLKRETQAFATFTEDSVWKAAPRPENKPGDRSLTSCRFRFTDEELLDRNPGEELARGAKLCRRCLFALRLDEAPTRRELARAAPWEAPPKPQAPPEPPPSSMRIKINVPPPKRDRPPPGPEGVVRKRMAWPDKLGGK